MCVFSYSNSSMSLFNMSSTIFRKTYSASQNRCFSHQGLPFSTLITSLFDIRRFFLSPIHIRCLHIHPKYSFKQNISSVKLIAKVPPSTEHFQLLTPKPSLQLTWLIIGLSTFCTAVLTVHSFGSINVSDDLFHHLRADGSSV